MSRSIHRGGEVARDYHRSKLLMRGAQVTIKYSSHSTFRIGIDNLERRTVCAAELEGGEDDGSQYKHRYDGRLVAQRKTVDDVRGGSSLARHCDLEARQSNTDTQHQDTIGYRALFHQLGHNHDKGTFPPPLSLNLGFTLTSRTGW